MTSKDDPEHVSQPPAIRDVKQQVRAKYLGKYGIHAVGVRIAQNAIRVYATRGMQEQQDGFEQIREDIAPCTLDIVFEDRPTIQPDP